MQTDGGKNNNDKSSKKTDPTILDKINFHLAEKLLGPKSIERFGIQYGHDDGGDDDGNTMTDSLYWRSELLIGKPTMLTPPLPREGDDDGGSDSSSRKNGEDSSSSSGKLAFVDITFYLKIEEDNTIMIESQFGCFLFNRPASEYVTAKPLTLSQLERHADSVGIVLENASAKGVAELMAAGLLRNDKSSENPTSATKVVNDDDDGNNSHLDLSIFYTSLSEYGVFNLDIENTTSHFDFHGLNLLMRFSEGRNMRGGGVGGEKTEEDKASTFEGGGSEEESFDIWKKRVSAQLVKKHEDDAKRKASASTAPPSTISDQKKKAKPKRTDGKGYNNKRHKKKRKNQLTYVQSK